MYSYSRCIKCCLIENFQDIPYRTVRVSDLDPYHLIRIRIKYFKNNLYGSGGAATLVGMIVLVFYDLLVLKTQTLLM